MTELNKHINTIQEAGVATLRSRLNQLLNSLGLTTATGGASLISLLIVAFLGINLFFVLNLACGLLLGEVLGSLGLGFLSLVGVYALLIIIYLLIKARVELSVQTRIARKMHLITDNINNNLNQIEDLRVADRYREAYISSEPFPYQSLRLRRDEANKQATKAGRDIKRGVQYIRLNYIHLFGNFMKENIPAYRYISPLTSILEHKHSNSKKHEAQPVAGFIEKYAQGIKPYMPYIEATFGFLRPIVSTYLMSKTQSWLLNKLLGRSSKKKK